MAQVADRLLLLDSAGRRAQSMVARDEAMLGPIHRERTRQKFASDPVDGVPAKQKNSVNCRTPLRRIERAKADDFVVFFSNPEIVRCARQDVGTAVALLSQILDHCGYSAR